MNKTQDRITSEHEGVKHRERKCRGKRDVEVRRAVITQSESSEREKWNEMKETVSEKTRICVRPKRKAETKDRLLCDAWARPPDSHVVGWKMEMDSLKHNRIFCGVCTFGESHIAFLALGNKLRLKLAAQMKNEDFWDNIQSNSWREETCSDSQQMQKRMRKWVKYNTDRMKKTMETRRGDGNGRVKRARREEWS